MDCRAKREAADPNCRDLLLRNYASPGDVTVMSAAIYTLHRQRPGMFRTAIQTSCDAVFEANPDIAGSLPNPETINVEYPAIHRSNELGITFMEAYVRFLANTLEVPLRLATNRPVIYLSQTEKKWMGRVQEVTGTNAPYWIVNAGLKDDFTCKAWPIEYYQRVVDELVGLVRFVQIGGAEENHNHPRLKNVIDQTGETDHRELIRLVYHCAGGLGPSTWLQHLCAAFMRPYILLLGGREPVPWTTYPLQHTLHTIGQLRCCSWKACWKSRVVKLGDGKEQDDSLCEFPIIGMERPVPKCMAMIRPAMVVEHVRRYLAVQTKVPVHECDRR